MLGSCFIFTATVKDLNFPFVVKWWENFPFECEIKLCNNKLSTDNGWANKAYVIYIEKSFVIVRHVQHIWWQVKIIVAWFMANITLKSRQTPSVYSICKNAYTLCLCWNTELSFQGFLNNQLSNNSV